MLGLDLSLCSNRGENFIFGLHAVALDPVTPSYLATQACRTTIIKSAAGRRLSHVNKTP